MRSILDPYFRASDPDLPAYALYVRKVVSMLSQEAEQANSHHQTIYAVNDEAKQQLCRYCHDLLRALPELVAVSKSSVLQATRMRGFR